MARVKVGKRVENGVMLGWQIRWRDPDGRQRKLMRSKKSEADQRAVEIEKSLQDHTYIDPIKGKKTFKSFAEEWRTKSSRSPNYDKGVEATLRLHVYPVIGHMAMNAIGEDDVQRIVTSLVAKGFVPSTIRNYMTLVRTIFKAAAKQRVRYGSPAEDISLPKVPRTKVSPLGDYEVGVLLQEMEARYKALIALAAATGGRQGELFGVQVGDVSWDERFPVVTFRRQLQVERDRGIVVRPLKDHEERQVHITSATLEILEKHIADFGHSKDGFIFTRASGGLMHARMFNARPWAKAREAAAAEIEKAAAGYDVRDPARAARLRAKAQKVASAGMHDLRDHYVSMMIRQGASITAVSALLGHSSQTTTFNHYAHLWDDHGEQTRAFVDANLAAIGARVPSE